MRENRHFICSIDLSGRIPALIGDRPAVFAYRALIERLEALAGPEAASLFAEPVLPRGASVLGPAVSWYCAYDGAVAELDSIDDVARKPIAQKLSTRLNALASALREPQIGPAFATWLNISSAADILSIGGEPVLVGWGFLPADAASDVTHRNDHFARTIGRFAPWMTTPPVEAPGIQSEEGSRPPTLNPAPPNADRHQATTGSASSGADGEMPASHAMGESNNAMDPRASPASPASTSSSWPARAWLAPLVATALAALVLAVLLLPGVLVYPAFTGQAERDAFEERRLRASNDSLEAQLAALRDADRAARVCRPGDPVVPVPGLRSDQPPRSETATGPREPEAEPRMELVPRAPDRLSNPRSPDGSKSIADLLDNVTVLVLSLKPPNGTSQGSGFFISDRHILTNHHVIQGVDEANIFITNHAIGGIRRARVVARTQPPPTDQDIRVDLAVLEIEPAADRISLPLGVTPPKLSTVYAAGFPGFITDKDADFGSFIQKLAGGMRRGNLDEVLHEHLAAIPGSDLKYGRVNNMMRTGDHALPIILHDMQLAPGNSGGPLIDACGRLAGVNTLLFMNSGGPQQANVALDVSLVRKFLIENNVPFKSEEGACDPSVVASDNSANAKSPGTGPDARGRAPTSGPPSTPTPEK